MADISSVTLPNGSSYDIKDKIARASIKFGKVNSTSTSTAFTATVEGITELYDGVAVYLTNGVVTSASGCTLDVNGLGAKPMYYTTAAASRVTTHFNIAYTWLFVYNSTRVSGGCWDAYWGYDSNSDAVGYNLRDGSNGYKVKNVLYRYQILFTYNNEYLLPSNTVQTSQTGPYSYTTEEFDPFGKIYTYTTTTQVAANGIPSSSYLYFAYATVDARWSFNVGTTLTPQKAVYIVAIPRKNGKAVLADPPVTQTLPTEEDGLLYIFLGQAYSTYQIAMSAEKPVYMFQDGAMKRITGIALESTSKRTLSGSIVHFEDGLDDFPVDDLVVDINPVQDLNGYDAPWPGGGSKNLCDYLNTDDLFVATSTTERSKTASIGSISVSGDTATLARTSAYAGLSVVLHNLAANTTYRISSTTDSGNGYYVGKVTWTSDTTYTSSPRVSSNSPTFTTTTAGDYDLLIWRDGTDAITLKNAQVELGTTATSYVPYSNICPITGWTGANVYHTGKNLCDYESVLDLAGWAEVDGVYSGSSNSLHMFTFFENYQLWSGQFSISVDAFVDDPTLRAGYLIAIYTDGTTTGENIIGQSWRKYSFVTTSGKTVQRIYFQRSNNRNLSFKNFQIELGATTTAFEAYQGTTIPITFPSSAGTVYGGTLDVTTGLLTVDAVSVTVDPANIAQSVLIYYVGTNSFPMKVGNGLPGICDRFPTVATSDYFGVRFGANNSIIYFYKLANLGITTLEEARAWFTANPTTVVYPLATPQTYQLTPTEVTTLIGVNNIWGDTGDSTVTYYNANLDGVVADTIKEFRDYRDTSDEDLDSLHNSIDNVANTVQEHYTALTSLNDYVRGQVYTLTTDSSVNPSVTYYQYLYSAEKDEYYYEVYQTQPVDNPASLGLYVLSDDPDSLKSRVEANTASIVANRYDINTMDNEISNLTGLSSEILTGIGSIRLGYIEDPEHQGSYFYGVCIGNNIGFDSTQHQNYPPESRAVYYLIDPKQTFTLITTDQVQFWVGGNLIGWFDKSDNVFHSIKQKVEQAMEVKDWQMVNSGGFGLRYIGV